MDSNYRLLLSFLLCFLLLHSHVNDIRLCYAKAQCTEVEREALLDFRGALTDPSARLSSWVGEDCCQWGGINCNNQTGQVIGIDLRNPYNFINGGVGDPAAYKNSCLGGRISPSLLQLHYLGYLDLSLNDFEGLEIPEFFGDMKQLTYLNLSFASFGGEIPPHLGNLSQLQYLDLYADSFSSSSTNELRAATLGWISSLSSLKYLNLGFSKLDGISEDWLQVVNKIPSLVELHLHWCQLKSLPVSLPYVNFTSLSVLDLSENSFGSQIPPWIFNLTSLTRLYLRWNFFSGSLPVGFLELKNLQVLDLSSNLNIEGQIPGIFGDLHELKVLDLSANSFSGRIDDFLGSFLSTNNSQLESLDLSSNSLVSELPESIKSLRNLQNLHLSGNSFWGSIPSAIGSLSSLKKLDLSFNSMNGSIPESFGLLSELIDVNLIENTWQGVMTEAHLKNLKRLGSIRLTTEPSRSLVFKMSNGWIPPFQLKSIQLQNCQVGPSFPTWLQVQKQLTSVTLKNVGISDTIPEEWFSNLSSELTYLDLSGNQIKGNLPATLQFPQLSAIDLSSNQFDGPIPLWSTIATKLYLHSNSFSGQIPENLGILMPRLQKLHLSWNHLSGKVPSSFCTMSELQIISLRSNHLSGELPYCWNHSQMLWGIDISDNDLSGNIPNSFGLLPSLSVLMLSNNKLYGEIPPSLQNRTGLTSIDLGKNKLSGNLPHWLENLSSLFMLRLESNILRGDVPDQVCGLPNLHIIDLSSNKLSGEIPKCIGKLPSLANGTSSEVFEGQIREVTRGQYPVSTIVNSINLSGNNLTGGMPEEITNLAGLRILNLSSNNLEQGIPEQMGKLQQLETLDLSHNHLSGSIPQALVSLVSLSKLNLSYNNLRGPIPYQPRFNDPSIYQGNPLLCGDPLLYLLLQWCGTLAVHWSETDNGRRIRGGLSDERGGATADSPPRRIFRFLELLFCVHARKF